MRSEFADNRRFPRAERVQMQQFRFSARGRDWSVARLVPRFLNAGAKRSGAPNLASSLAARCAHGLQRKSI
jgi:predicted DNA-binding ribbon-helix-helix protein